MHAEDGSDLQPQHDRHDLIRHLGFLCLVEGKIKLQMAGEEGILVSPDPGSVRWHHLFT